MVIEHAVLNVKAGQTDAFESAMREAKPLIAASPGFEGIEVRPSVREENQYLLIVRWRDIAAHEDGFRKSEHYAKWRELLHGFYESMPQVTYFEEPIVS